MEKAPIIGIDLGTTNCCVAVYEDDKVNVIFNETGARIIPSFVTFENGRRIIGEEAKEKGIYLLKDTIYDSKRFIGRLFSDEVVKEDMKNWAFEVAEHDSKLVVYIESEKRWFQPQEISAMILTKMKKLSEDYLGKKVKEAVITVPAHFNDSQRRATMDAAKIAGLKVRKLLIEPTAAAIAYSMHKKSDQTRTVLVYDLGGGTFDVSLLQIKGNDVNVIAIEGDPHLGGADFDNRLAKYIIDGHSRKYKSTPSEVMVRRLYRKCENAKIILSSTNTHTIDVPEFAKNSQGEIIDLKMPITRQCFENINKDLFEKTIHAVKCAIDKAKIDKMSVDEIVVVGGSTRIPKIRDMLTEFFEGKKLNMQMHPDEAVAVGAAIFAETVQSATTKGIQLKDVTPFSIGVELYDARYAIVIPRNTVIPVTRTKVFSTIVDDQTEAKYSIYEGERLIASENEFLGDLLITDLPKAKASQINLKTIFEIDENMLLKVTAVETITLKSVSTEIKYHRGGMSLEEIDRRIKIQEEYHTKDKERLKGVIAKMKLEKLCYKIETKLTGNDAVVVSSETEKSIILKKCKNTMEWLNDEKIPAVEVVNKIVKEFETLYANLHL